MRPFSAIPRINDMPVVFRKRGFDARTENWMGKTIRQRRQEIEDGRTLGIPLAWYPRLLHGTPEQRDQVTISVTGLHWEALNEDISIAGLLAGRGDMTRATKRAA